MRVILDTNAWLDWLVFDDASIAPLAHAIDAGEARVLATGAMLDEFADVIGRTAFALDARRRAALLARQRASVRLCDDAPDCRLPCTDPDDRMFADLAVAHRVDWLITRDKALLRLRRVAGRRFGVRIGTPRQWAEAVAAPPL